MRIAYDAMLLSECRSGVEVSIRSLAEALRTHGKHSYDVYLPAASEAALHPSPRMFVHHVRAVARSRISRLAWEQLALPRQLKRDGCRLLHAPGYLAPLHCAVPVVLTVFDVMALTQPHLCRPANRFNYRTMLPISLCRAKAIIVPSAFSAGEIERCLPECREKVHIIPLAVRESVQAMPREELSVVRERLGLPERFVLFVGREEPKKNVEGLLRAYAELRANGQAEHALVLAGPPGPSTAGITRAIRELGLARWVARLGYVADADLAALYRLCDAFAFLSHYEGFGLPPLEAMACGAPVICSNAAALPDTVGDAALMVPPGDTAAAAAAIREVLVDHATRRDLVARGRTRAGATSWADIARQTEALYESVSSSSTQQPVAAWKP